jgi:lysine biosynthesis protein LysW
VPSGNCPDCERRISLSPASVGQKLTCPHCHIELEVVSAEPRLELQWNIDWEWGGDDEELKEVVERFCDRVWNRGKLAETGKLVASNCVCDDPLTPTRDRDALKWHVASLRAAFPDLRLVIEDMVAEDDKVVARWSLTGTHEGALPALRVRPTGEQVTLTGISIYRIEDGRIVEIWREADYLGLLNEIRPMSRVV